MESKESLQIDLTNTSPYRKGRPVVRGKQGMVSSGHYLTSMSAMRMLISGGNAFDAAAAAGFAAAVIEPNASYSLATEGSFMLYHADSHRLRVLSGQGVAPGKATVELFKEKGLDKIPTGVNAHLAFTVPGVVDAYITLLEEYGTKPLREVMAPAIHYARHGFPMYEYMRQKLLIPLYKEQFRRYPPGGMDIFYPQGEPHEVGQLLVQKALSATLSKLADADASCGSRLAGLESAREVFYRGEVAQTIVQCSGRVGGLLSMDDLANYRASFENPISINLLGYEVYAQSVWTQAGVALQALNILESFDPQFPKGLRAMGHNTPQYIHTLTEALKLAFADRERYYADPNFASVPIDGLLSKEYAAMRACLIRSGQAYPQQQEAGDPWSYCDGGEAGAVPAPAVAVPTPGDGGQAPKDGTTHFAVIDQEGNMVCATVSGGKFDSSVFFPELGCTLSTRSEMFFLDPQRPNGLHPGKRPRTTLVNYIICKDGQPVMTIGCPGADDQAQADLQLILNMLVFSMYPQQAVEAPRFSSQSMVNSFYPRVYLPGQLNVEPGISEEVRSELASLGHKIVEDPMCGYGAIVTQRDPRTGVIGAGADPRLPTYAIGW